MNSSSKNEEGFSCLDDHLSSNSVTQDVWKIYKDFQYGSPIVAAILIIFLSVAFTCNLFIIVSMLWQRMLKQPAQILLLNLAVSDFLVSGLVMPFTITSGIAREYVFGDSDSTRCKVCQSGIVFVILSQVSFHSIALLSLDRFLFIRFPFRYKKLVTVRRTAVVVLAVWVLCVLLSLPPLFGFGEVKLSTSVGNCFISFFGETHVTRNIFYLLLLVMEALFPIAILIVTNVWLLCIIVKHIHQKFWMQRHLASDERSNAKRSIQGSLYQRRNRQQLQLVKVFTAIFIANLITWLPAIVLAISAPFINFDHIPAEVIAIVYLSYISHTVIHPLLESFFILKLRKLIVQCLYCGRRSQSPPQEQGSSYRGDSSNRCRRASTRPTENSTGVNENGESRGGGGGERDWRWRDCCSCAVLDTCTALLLSDTGGGEGGEKEGRVGVSPSQDPHSPTTTELSIVSPFVQELNIPVDIQEPRVPS